MNGKLGIYEEICGNFLRKRFNISKTFKGQDIAVLCNSQAAIPGLNFNAVDIWHMTYP